MLQEIILDDQRYSNRNLIVSFYLTPVPSESKTPKLYSCIFSHIRGYILRMVSTGWRTHDVIGKCIEEQWDIKHGHALTPMHTLSEIANSLIFVSGKVANVY